ncbi:MAG: DNA gyrase inhibitor YacG [Rhodospirillales bacterium]|nr:DNA gyrase inhibitor YacG [Rhodospirillales bacterium]
MTDDARIVPLPRKRKKGAACPICGAPAVSGHRPFCSKRCAEIDLGRWLKGGYRVPTEEAPAEGETPPEDED